MDWSQLPAVVLAEVLGYLPLRDQLSARRVCKYWKLVNDSSVPRKELILFIKIHPRPVYWQHNQRAADPANGLMVNYLFMESEFLCHEFFWPYFRKIQRLMVAFPMNSLCKNLVKQIQKSFTDLQHLQFSSIGNQKHFIPQKAPQNEFHLKNLRTLYSCAAVVPVVLNCPKLTELFIYNDLIIDETTSKRAKKFLQHLKMLRVNNLVYPLGFEFSNLQVLSLISFPTSLADFPMLKELHCHMYRKIRDEDLVEELLRQKEHLKREDLRIFFQGFDLERHSFFELLRKHVYPSEEPLLGFNYFNTEVLRLAKESPSSCNFSLYRRGFDMRDSLDDELAGLQEGELPECLFRSITDLFIRKLTKVSPTFFEISHKFPYIRSVTINGELTQTLLDRLPDVLPGLASFVYPRSAFRDEQFSFEFVARFKSLNYFYICNRFLTINEFQMIIQSCQVLEEVKLFQPENEHGYVRLDMYPWIERTGKPERIYELYWKKINADKTFVIFARTSFDHDELLKYLTTSKWISKVSKVF